jgi:hypothetical protein
MHHSANPIAIGYFTPKRSTKNPGGDLEQRVAPEKDRVQQAALRIVQLKELLKGGVSE